MSSALFAELLSLGRVSQTHGLCHPWFHHSLFDEPRELGKVCRLSLHHHVDGVDSGLPRTALIRRLDSASYDAALFDDCIRATKRSSADQVDYGVGSVDLVFKAFVPVRPDGQQSGWHTSRHHLQHPGSTVSCRA